jgi:hypothetical protein
MGAEEKRPDLTWSSQKTVIETLMFELDVGR